VAIVLTAAGVALMARAAFGQSSSLAGGAAKVTSRTPPPAEPPEYQGAGEVERNAALEQSSFIAVVLPPPRKFRVHDLITVIVQEQKQWESDGRTREENELNITAKLKEWFRFYPEHRLGSDQLSNGQPGVDFEFEAERRARGQTDREDRLTIRVQVEVIDVKPNGVLVFEAQRRIEHDEEDIEVTLLGKCRSEDIGPDNAVLSTKVADLDIVIKNNGITRDITERGWLSKLWGIVHPI
jgi:flagellar L-ring protein precursor FlgH